MPSPFFAASNPRLASPLLLSIVLATSGFMLIGCKGSNPTTRTTSSDLVPTPNTSTFKLTLQSPVELTNVEARVIDPISGQILHQEVIANDDQLTIELKASVLASKPLLYVELKPTGSNQSSYYDPIVDKKVPFNLPLRALVKNTTGSQKIVIDPYTEITFQRAQIRAGWLTNRSDLSQLGMINLNALNAATAEVDSVFNVRNNIVLSQGINARNDLKNLTLANNQLNILDYFRFALGHIQQYAQQQPNATSPYLIFSQKAALDMLDGDLDGLTLYGFGDRNKIFLNQPLVQPIINSDPNRNQQSLLAVDQLLARRVYNLAVGDAIKQLFNPLFVVGSAEFQLINLYDYLNLDSRGNRFSLRSAGAGNYTRAFGLADNQVLKNYLNADDTGLVSDIEQIAGLYQNSQGCQLELRPNGRVTLSQGTQYFTADIDRNFNDSMSRSNTASQAYLINITTPSDSTPSFLQVRTDGARILSAQSGRSLLDAPDQLAQVDLSCSF